MQHSPDIKANPFDPYRTLLGGEVIDSLYQIAALLGKIKIVHVNSTKEGGGVAEILTKMVPLTNLLGLETHWEVIKGNGDFFQCTKMFHNLLQGKGGVIPSTTLLSNYEKTNKDNAEALRKELEEADIVVIHDPQPLAMIDHFPNRKGKWIFRCHIDCSTPSRAIWKYLKKFIEKFDAAIFSMEDFVQPLSIPIFLITPSIDPFSEKNIELDQEEIGQVYKKFGISLEHAILLQVSRFDGFKDPLGVIQAYRLAKKFNPTLQLILAGGGAVDDPEGEVILNDVKNEAAGDPNIHILFLPGNEPRVINALQRGADIILQKSIKEGFGLTVTEALWKKKPVIGGNTGGIKLQVINHHTGFLVDSPEGAALRTRFFLDYPEKGEEFGSKGRKLVKENFLITRQIRDYLTLFATLRFSVHDRLDFSQKIR